MGRRVISSQLIEFRWGSGVDRRVTSGLVTIRVRSENWPLRRFSGAIRGWEGFMRSQVSKSRSGAPGNKIDEEEKAERGSVREDCGGAEAAGRRPRRPASSPGAGAPPRIQTVYSARATLHPRIQILGLWRRRCLGIRATSEVREQEQHRLRSESAPRLCPVAYLSSTSIPSSQIVCGVLREDKQ